MRIVIFFVCLFVSLLKGYDGLYAHTQHGAHYSISPRFNLVKYTNTNRDKAVIVNTDLANEQRFLLSDVVEDEEINNNYFIRKFRVLTNYYYAFCNPAVLSGLHNYFKVSPSFCSQASDIYIFQRVLRI